MIWIVDDFYPNPDEIRNRALMLDYTRGKSTNKARVSHILHPGHRNNPKREFWWENRIYLRGPGPRMYACVIYLTPNPPANTGTLLFEHKGSIFDEQEKKKDKKRYHPQFYGEYWKDPISTNPAWKMHCKVENRYNRLVMYDARMLHAPENAGFGDTKETARLTQIGFWYGEDRVQI